MSDDADDIELRILDACNKAASQKKPNIAALAREFAVPVGRLRRRYQGRPSNLDKTPVNKMLDDAQEGAIIRWIRQLDSLYSPPTPKMIEDCANQILQRNVGSDELPRQVSKSWVYRFIDRLPADLNLTKQRPIDKKRLEAEDIGLLQHWFDSLEPIIAKISPKNIYNFDETGFQLGQGKSQKVVTANPIQASRGIGSGEINESLTAIECISADGAVIPPYIIFKGKYHLERWYQSPNLPDDYRVATTPKGYITDEIAFDWLHHFDKYTTPRLSSGQSRLLFMDGHGSHLTYEFIQYCEDQKIILYCFLPHTTHLVQPLDGQPFQVYKHYFRKKNNENAQWGVPATDKADFLRDLPEIRLQTFKQRTIRSAFADRGIYPLNSAKIIDPLVKARSPTPTLKGWEQDTPPPGSSSTNSPPGTIRTLRRSIKKAEVFLDNQPGLDESFTRWLGRLFQSSLETAELASQLQVDLRQRLRDKKPPKTRRSRRQITDFGPLTIKDANRAIKRRADEELDQLIKRGRKAQGLPTNTTTPAKTMNNPAIQGSGGWYFDSNGYFNS